MAPKRSNIDDTKELLKGMLNGIYEQIRILEDFVHKCKNEAIKEGEELLAEKSKTRFFRKFPLVSHQLGETLSQVSLVTEAISSLDEDAAESSTDEDQKDDANSEQSECTVISRNTLTVQEVDQPENEVRSVESSSIEGYGTIDATQVDEKQVVKQKLAAVEKPVIPEEPKVFIPEEKLDVPLPHVPKSDPKCAENIAVHTSKAKRISPRQSKRISPASSVSPLLPKVLTNEVKVPKAKVDFEVSQTVLVTGVDHPWSFYLQVYNAAYDHFMEKLCLHFSKQASQGYKGGISNIPDVGSYCCAKSPSDQTWYRAQILGVKTMDATECAADYAESVTSYLDDPVLNSILVSVFMIDQGVRADVTIRHIRPLDAQFAELPAQAVHCMLGGVAPLNYDAHRGTASWSKESIDWFTHILKSEHFFTGFFYEPSAALGCIPVDLYTGEHSSSSDAPLPPIETHVAHMMLLVSLASPYHQAHSHVIEHFHEIDAIGYKAADHIIDDEESASISIEIEKTVEAINSESKQTDVNSRSKREVNDIDKELASYEKNETGQKVVDNQSSRECNMVCPDQSLSRSELNPDQSLSRPELNPDQSLSRPELNPDRSLSKPKLNATFENRFIEKKFTVGAEGFCPVLVSTVSDPGLFYVHLITPDVRMLDEMLQELNQCYFVNEFPIPDTRLDIGNAVVVKYSEDGNWYRAVIKHLRIPDTGKDSYTEQPRSSGSQFEYEVLHVDFGSSEWVKHENIRPVVEKFFELPMATLPCCLADIEPMEISRDISTSSSSSDSNSKARRLSSEIRGNMKETGFTKIRRESLEVAAGDEDFNSVFHREDHTFSQLKGAKWSEAAIKRLEQLTLDGEQRMASLKCEELSKRLPDEPIPIYLYNTNEKDAVCINKVLVDEALAVSNVLPKTTEETTPREHRKITITQSELEKIALKIAEGQTVGTKDSTPLSPGSAAMDNWDPMKEVFMSNRNAYSIDTDDPGTAISGFSEPRGNICQYFFSEMGCLRGASCTFEHPYTGDPNFARVETFGFVNSNDQFPEIPTIGSFVLVQITSLITPVHFHVRFPYGTIHLDRILQASSSLDDDRDELMDLQEEMNKSFSTMPYNRSEMTTFQEGDLVAARFPEDGEWYRARVYHVLEGDYQVGYIDFGNEAVVQAKDVRKLVPQFMKLKPQAVEAFLANVELAPDVMKDRSLQKEATELFEQTVGDGVLTAKVMSASSNGTVNLELYNRETAVCINSMLLAKKYFTRSQKEITRPWSICDAMAVNTDITHFTPG